MRQLELSLIRTRSVLRKAWSRMASTDPDLGAPARLVLQVDDGDLVGSCGTSERLTMNEWQRAITQVVERLGPLPVTVLATHSSEHPDVPLLVRFTHRLGCTTLLMTDGGGIDEAKAHQLIDCGLESVRLLVGGVSESVQRQTVGNAAVEATSGLAALLKARQERRVDLDIEIAIPWVKGVTLEINAVVGWARQAGADGFRIIAPYRAHDLPADPELLDQLVDDNEAFCRNSSRSIDELHTMVAHQDKAPGIARTHSLRRGKCPVGGQRLVIGARRAVYSCPFHPPIGELDDEFSTVWALAGPHLTAISDCTRACVHTELAPEPIFG